MAAVVIAPIARPEPHRIPVSAPSPREPWPSPPAAGASRGAGRRLAPAIYRRRRLGVAVVAALSLLGTIELVARVADGLVSPRTVPAVGQVAPDITGASGPSSAGVVPSPAGSAGVYIVEPGDTLWSIARHLDPEGDPRPIIHRLSEQAGSSSLRPGQRLSLDGIR